MKNILRPSKTKIILNLLIFLGFFWVAIFVPTVGFSGTFGQLSLGQKIISFFLSGIMCIIYYPLAASLVYLANCVKNSIYQMKEIILALIFLAIFNPLTVSLVVSKIFSHKLAPTTNTVLPDNNSEAKNNLPPESVCGLMINEIMANSKISEAGIGKGDVILKLNGMEIKSVQDIFDQLDKKKPGDIILLETSKGPKTVELARDPNDPNHPVLGVKLVSNPCVK